MIIIDEHCKYITDNKDLIVYPRMDQAREAQKRSSGHCISFGAAITGRRYRRIIVRKDHITPREFRWLYETVFTCLEHYD